MNSSLAVITNAKAKLAELVAWDKRLPDYVFTKRGYPFPYFFEGSVTGRRALLEEIIGVMSAAYNSEVCISIAHDARSGQYELDEISATTLIVTTQSGASSISDGLQFSEYIASHPYTGITCGTNESQDWLLYDYPAEMIGVIVCRSRIERLVADSEYIFNLERFLSIASSPGMGLAGEFLSSIKKHYGSASKRAKRGSGSFF